MKKLILSLFLAIPGYSLAAPGDVVSLGEDKNATFRLNSTSMTIEPDIAPLRDLNSDLGAPNNRFHRLYVGEIFESSSTLAPGSSNYAQINPAAEQAGAVNLASATLNRLHIDSSISGLSGSIQANMLQGGNSNYAQVSPSSEQAGFVNIDSVTANRIHVDSSVSGPSGSIQASMLQSGNTSYHGVGANQIPLPSLIGFSTTAVQNQNTMQSGATSYAEFTQTRNLSVYGTPNLAVGASNYIQNTTTPESKNFSVAQGTAAILNFGHAQSTGTATVQTATVGGTLTAGVLSVTGNTTLGDAGTDLITVNAGTSTYADGHVFNLGTRAYVDVAGDALRIRLGTNIGRLSIQDGDGTQNISFTAGGGASIGWTIQAAANQACNTTCTNGCVMGTDAVTFGFLACTDATADSCLCAGPN